MFVSLCKHRRRFALFSIHENAKSPKPGPIARPFSGIEKRKIFRPPVQAPAVALPGRKKHGKGSMFSAQLSALFF